MKASEIMINDLIYVYGQNGNIAANPHWYVRKVTADWLVDMVRSEEKDRCIADNGITIPDSQLFIGNTKPIPLTEEILKANGFRFIDEKRLFFVPDEGGSISYQTVTHFVSVGCDGSVRKNIGFVHEFQHALRLCGLNDLADNFKIE